MLCLMMEIRDKVEWDEEQDSIALAAVERQMASPVSDELREVYNNAPASFWDTFYAGNKGSLTRLSGFMNRILNTRH